MTTRLQQRDISKRGGNYTSTRTEIQPDKTGALYTTSMGSPGASIGFGINVWKSVQGKPDQLLLSFPGHHGSLHVLNKQLILALNTPDRRQLLIPIEGYVYPGDTVNSTTVNINDKQVAELKQMIANVQAANDRLANRVAQIEAVNAQQARQIKELQDRPSGGGSVNEQQIADIVWTKLWDAFYLIRMGMNAGWSNDPNIQGWINDLTSFIKKVK